jgi:MFS-type transporter involved in bile tolerance (Atg22 family)
MHDSVNQPLHLVHPSLSLLLTYFLFIKGLNTTQTLLSIIQNDAFHFSFLKNTYLGILQAACWISGGLVFWYIQRHWKLSTKKMLVVATFQAILLPVWGLIGLGTQKFGFHKHWEFWVKNVIQSLFQAPFYAFSQTTMAELSPPGYSSMFFGLYGITTYASSIIGPNVLQAIINRRHNNWLGFPLVFALCFSGCFIIWFFVDIQQGKRDAVAWAESQRALTGERSLPVSSNIEEPGSPTS